MQIKKIKDIVGTSRDVKFNGGNSQRLLLESDNMGFSFFKTIIPKGGPYNWHYKYHLEACYCLKGKGIITDLSTNEKFDIEPETLYVLDNHDNHTFEALEDVILISVFNPPLSGLETHDENNSYKPNGKSPVYNVRGVPLHDIEANNYNPNSVAPPEMALLYDSIKEDGYTMPVVCYYDDTRKKYIIVDGFHRYTIMLKHKDIYDRENGLLPVAVIDKPIEDRMASTIRHNRARGSHDIQLMSSIVSELVEIGKSDRWIRQHLGMDADELLRLKQTTGLASLFRDVDFSEAWEVNSESGEY